MSIIDEGYFVFFVKKIIVRVLRLFAEIERKKKEMKNLIMFFVFEIGEQRVLPSLTFFFLRSILRGILRFNVFWYFPKRN